MTQDYRVYFGTPNTTVLVTASTYVEAVAAARAYHVNRGAPNWAKGIPFVTPCDYVDRRPDLPHPREVLYRDYADYPGWCECEECGVPLTKRETYDTADEGYGGHCRDCWCGKRGGEPDGRESDDATMGAT